MQETKKTKPVENVPETTTKKPTVSPSPLATKTKTVKPAVKQKIDLEAIAAQRDKLIPDEVDRAIAEELAEDRRWLSSSVPRKIHFSSVHCYNGQGEGKEKIKIKYDLHVVDSKVTLKNIEFIDDPLDDAQFLGCIRTAMENFTTPANVADTVENEEMILSIRGLKKILRQQASDRE